MFGILCKLLFCEDPNVTKWLRYWSDGQMLLAKDEESARALADLIEETDGDEITVSQFSDLWCLSLA